MSSIVTNFIAPVYSRFLNILVNIDFIWNKLHPKSEYRYAYLSIVKQSKQVTTYKIKQTLSADDDL